MSVSEFTYKLIECDKCVKKSISKPTTPVVFIVSVKVRLNGSTWQVCCTCVRTHGHVVQARTYSVHRARSLPQPALSSDILIATLIVSFYTMSNNFVDRNTKYRINIWTKGECGRGGLWRVTSTKQKPTRNKNSSLSVVLWVGTFLPSG